jgi:hypothetical protein
MIGHENPHSFLPGLCATVPTQGSTLAQCFMFPRAAAESKILPTPLNLPNLTGCAP